MTNSTIEIVRFRKHTQIIETESRLDTLALARSELSHHISLCFRYGAATNQIFWQRIIRIELKFVQIYSFFLFSVH